MLCHAEPTLDLFLSGPSGDEDEQREDLSEAEPSSSSIAASGQRPSARAAGPAASSVSAAPSPAAAAAACREDGVPERGRDAVAQDVAQEERPGQRGGGGGRRGRRQSPEGLLKAATLGLSHCAGCEERIEAEMIRQRLNFKPGLFLLLQTSCVINMAWSSLQSVWHDPLSHERSPHLTHKLCLQLISLPPPPLLTPPSLS